MHWLAPVLLAAALSGCSSVDYCQESGVTKDLALMAANDFVKDRLRAPASAKFPTNSSGNGVYVRKSGQCRYVVNAYVDAQNGFGALLRTDYLAEVEGDNAAKGFKLIRLHLIE